MTIAFLGCVDSMPQSRIEDWAANNIKSFCFGRGGVASMFLLLFLVFGVPAKLMAQYTVTSCQGNTDATVNLDRSNFAHATQANVNEAYLHNFAAPTLPCGIVSPSLTSVTIDITINDINTSAGCAGVPIFANVQRNCTLPSGRCDVLEDALSAGCSTFAGVTTAGSYSYSLSNCRTIDFDDIIGVDLVPATDFSPSCPSTSQAITNGVVVLDYEICITYVYDQAESLPVADPDHSEVCPNDGAIELIGSTTTSGTTIDYSWTGPGGFTANGASAFTDNPADEGTYTLIVTVDGCVSDPVDVAVEYLTFAPQVAAANSNVCFGANIDLAVTGGGTNFAWFDPSGNPVGGNSSTLTTTAGGIGGTQTYSVTVSNASCTENLTVNVVVSDEIMGDIILNPVGGVCAGVPTMFTARRTDGSSFPAGWTFDWNSGDGTGPTYSFTENTPGGYTMEVIVMNPAGCSVTLSEGFNVTATGGSTGQISSIPFGRVCADDPIEFTALMGDGSPFPSGWTFDWNNGDGSGSTFEITENTPDDYTVGVMVTNPSGCSFMLSEPFTVAELPSVSISPVATTICSDGSVDLVATVNGGTGNIDYLWAPQNVETSSTLTIDATSPFNQSLFVGVMDENGCTAFSNLADVDVLPDLPAVTFNACASGSATEVTFSWNDVGQTVFEIYLTETGGSEQTISTSYTNLSYTATGLTPGSSATLRVVPVATSNGVTCFGPPQFQTCSTANVACDNPGWLFTAIDPICLTTDGQAFDLTINTTATGTVVLNSTDLSLTNQPNGPGGISTVSLPALPSATSSGVYTVMASFVLPDGSCPFDTTFNIPVVTPADPEISTSLSSICAAQEIVSFNLVNAYDSNSRYTITVDNASGSFITLEDAPNQVFQISFSEYRTYQVTITTTTVGNNACTQSFTLPFTLTEPPAKPTLTCAGTGLDSVAFSWSDVGAASYTVDQITVPGTGVVEQTARGFIVRSLVAGDAVTIAVTANVPGCPSAISDTITCVAQACSIIVPQITTPVDTFCADGAEALVNLTVNVPAAGTVVWSGPGVTGTQFDPAAAGAGEHEITVEYTEGNCDYPASFQLIVVDPPSGMMNIVADSTCQGGTSTVSFTGNNLGNAAFEWIFPTAATVVSGDINGPGPLEVSFSGLGDQFAQLVITGPFCEVDTLRDSIFVATPIVEVSLECANIGLDQVGFSWTHPTTNNFTVTILSQPAGATINQLNNSLLATGLAEGESVTIEVTALGNSNCPDGQPVSLTCTAVSCPSISFGIDQVGPFCVGDDVDVQLTTSLIGSDGSGVLTFADSTFSTGGNFNSTGLAPGFYTVTATFEERGCPFPALVEIEITDLPDPSFILDGGPVCIGEFVGADAGAGVVGRSNTWLVPDASATVVETSMTTRNISWSTVGMKEVILIVSDANGCEDRSRETIEVIAPLSAPVIGCGVSTFSSVEFNWNTETGVDSFQIIVNGGASFFQDSTNLFVGGLTDGELVNIQVIALSSGACGNSPVGMSDCTTDSCPTITVTPPGNQNFCLGATGNTIPLTAIQAGGAGTGLFTFSGPGITGSAGAFSFNADAAGPGAHTITVMYDESVCSGMATFEFTVSAKPTSNFTLNGQTMNLTLCAGEVFTLAYSGDLPQASNGTFNWNFTPAIGGADGGYESYSLSYANAGDYVISLSVEDNGCDSEITRLNITVEALPSAPVVNCIDASLNSLTFGWAPVPAAEGYLLSDGTMLRADELSYTISGLMPSESVAISVVTTSSCGNSTPSIVTTCTSVAEDCSNGATDVVACDDGDPCTDNDMETVLISDPSIICLPCAGIPQDCENSPTVSLPCDDGDDTTVNDQQTILCDGTICMPCAGVPCDFAISLDPDLTISIGDSLPLRLVSNEVVDSLIWEEVPGLSCYNCLEPIAKPTQTTSYSVRAFDENGCETTANITILVDEKRNIYIPNVFSPNGDGINDHFEIQGGPDVRQVSRFSIYNRWGAELFNVADLPVNSPEGRWRGEHRGQPVEAGVYIYVAVVEFTDGHVEKISGEVLVMR